MNIFFLILFSFLLVQTANSQQFHIKPYKVADGLPIDVIKAVNQDQNGFIWIATDNGLVKYDGIAFETFKSVLRSRYAKEFLKTRDKRLFLITDLDFIEIDNQIDTIIFKNIIKGSHQPTDSTISYPKALYEDAQKNIWIAEPKSVVRYSQGKIERFFFDDRFKSIEFDRSFHFVEDAQKNLFVISYNGYVFRYDSTQKAFKQLVGKLCKDVNHVLMINNKLYVGAKSGLYLAQINSTQVVSVSKTNFPFGYISKLHLAPDSSIFICTYSYDLFRMPFYNNFTYTKVNYEFNDIRGCYTSSEGDHWVSTHKGLVLLQKQIFKVPYIDPKAKFIESVAQDKTNQTIYFCDKEKLSSIKWTGKGVAETKDVLYKPEGYFQTLESNTNGLWATNEQKVLLFKNDKLFRTFDFSSYGNFVYDLYCDENNSIWVAQSNSRYVFEIKNDVDTLKYKLPISYSSDIGIIEGGEEGIYVAALGNIKEYLFFKPKGSSKFINVSPSLSIKVTDEFQILNMVVIGKAVWLATSIGLLKYENNKIERVDLGLLLTESVNTSIAKLDENNILFSSFYGLVRYNFLSKEYWIYDENMGLPANTITDHGILIDAQKRVWIGSSIGMAYTNASDLLKTKPTPIPYCTEAKVNGKSVRYNNGIKVPYGAFVNLKFSSVTFPENRVLLLWKLKDSKDEWKLIENHELNFSDLPQGQYEILVKAKKNTGLSWSPTKSLLMEVAHPYWFTLPFISMIACILGFTVWISIFITSKITHRTKSHLQNLVKLRTRALEETNKELSLRNQELDRFVYSASHDMGAPLKSILGLISIARMEDSREAIEKYFGMMESSIKKLDNFIKEVISYSRNSRMAIQKEEIDFELLINELIADLQFADNVSFIKFIVSNRSNLPLVSDVSRLKIIFNNLISNAIKFHIEKEGVEAFVKVTLEAEQGNYQITVEDNGRGIEEKYLSSIFEMFYRATVDVQGTGLGLYILKETIAKLNGEVNVTSELHKGTKFVVTIPIPSFK